MLEVSFVFLNQNFVSILVMDSQRSIILLKSLRRVGIIKPFFDELLNKTPILLNLLKNEKATASTVQYPGPIH